MKRLQDKYIPNKKYEETEESKGWRRLTQQEMDIQGKDLCKEMEEEVLNTYKIEEGKRGCFQGTGDEPEVYEKSGKEANHVGR